MKRVTHDKTSDAAYLYFRDLPEGEKVAHTESVDNGKQGSDWAMVNLDFDKAGRLLGVEVLGASRVLPPEVLEKANAPDR